MEHKRKILETKDILKILPHRYPFLLIDRVINLIPGQEGTGIKNVSINEPFFQGHFCECPIMPGVLIIEACGQLAGLVLSENASSQNNKPNIEYLASVQKFNFKNKVHPGDQLILSAFNFKKFQQLVQVSVKVEVNKVSVAEGVLILTNTLNRGEK